MFKHKPAYDLSDTEKRELITKDSADWANYWTMDFDYRSRREIIKVAKESGVNALIPAPDAVIPAKPAPGYDRGAGIHDSANPLDSRLRGSDEGGGEVEFEERWTGSYIFENEWQSFSTRKNRLEFISAPHRSGSGSGLELTHSTFCAEPS